MIQLNAPIFINVELSRSFVNEYPLCSTTGKIIILPYPNTDPDMLSGKYMKIQDMNFTSHEKQLFEYQRRDKLVFYHGGMHGSCEFIRRALVIDSMRYIDNRIYTDILMLCTCMVVYLYVFMYVCNNLGGNYAR